MSLVNLKNLLPALAFAGICAATAASWDAWLSYDNEFIDPSYILSKPWTSSPSLQDAADTIVAYADVLRSQGPWSVTFKKAPIVAPSGDPHDYLSWAPYWWPDCSHAGNTTALTDQEVWTRCVYVDRDGEFVPDARLVNDTGSFMALADTAMFNALAWQITGNDSYAHTAADFINTWYLDDTTHMNPNLNYSQVKRGPGVQVGNKSGVLDMKNTAKILIAVLLFRKTGFVGWTQEMDHKMREWSSAFIKWLQVHPFGIAEMGSTNNHGTYWVNTMVSHQLIVDDIPEAQRYLNAFFDGHYLKQIDANGEQPLEALRSRSFHYRAYNLGALITNAKLAAYVELPALWTHPSAQNGTIQKALDYAIARDPAATHERGDASEIHQHVAAVAAHFGDPSGKYAAFLQGQDAAFRMRPYFLWNQPLAQGNSTTGTPPTGLQGTQNPDGGVGVGPVSNTWLVLVAVVVQVVVHMW